MSVAIATCQPSPTPPMRWASGMRSVGEEDLVELGFAGHLPERAHLDTLLVHVDEEVRQALGASGTSGSVRTSSRPHSATWAMLVQTFCPFTTHSSPSRTARVQSAATSDPAPGSLNIWHQISSQVNVGRRRRRSLLFGAEGDQRGAGHADAHHVA